MRSELAKARDKWLESDEGTGCSAGRAHGQYLRNRIEKAFIAGWEACEQTTLHTLSQVPAGEVEESPKNLYEGLPAGSPMVIKIYRAYRDGRAKGFVDGCKEHAAHAT